MVWSTYLSTGNKTLVQDSMVSCDWSNSGDTLIVKEGSEEVTQWRVAEETNITDDKVSYKMRFAVTKET